MDYDEKLASLEKDKKFFERCGFRSSYTDYLRYYWDYTCLQWVFDLLEEEFKFEYNENKKFLKKYNKQMKNFRYEDIAFNKKNIQNGIDMYEVLTRVSDLFNDSEFIDYNNPGYISINCNERLDIIYSYLDYLIPNGSKLYKDLRERFSCLTGLEIPGGVAGESMILYTRPEDTTVFIDDRLRGRDIYYMVTVIHEIMHHYSGIIIGDYGNANLQALINGNLGEVLSVYSEFSFLDWLKKNRIYTKHAELYKNYNLSTYFTFLERIRYYFFCLKNNAEVNIENDYEIKIPKNELNFDSYYTVEKLKAERGFSSIHIKYILGFLKTFDFLKMEASGENMDRAIRDFIARIADKKQETSIILNEKNDDAICKYIKDNTEECKRLYRYK